MGKSRRLVVFDWEGTLADTLGHTLQVVAQEVRNMHFGELDLDTARRCADLGLVQALRKLFPTESLHRHQQLLEAVQHRLLTGTSDICLFPGVREILADLHEAGFFLAVASNKGQQSLERAIRNAGLSDYFPVFRSASMTEPKPSPVMLLELMDCFAVSPEVTLMVGDSLNDIHMAVAADVDAVGMDFYHQQDAALRAAGAIAVYQAYDQLAAFLGLTGQVRDSGKG